MKFSTFALCISSFIFVFNTFSTQAAFSENFLKKVKTVTDDEDFPSISLFDSLQLSKQGEESLLDSESNSLIDPSFKGDFDERFIIDIKHKKIDVVVNIYVDLKDKDAKTILKLLTAYYGPNVEELYDIFEPQKKTALIPNETKSSLSDTDLSLSDHSSRNDSSSDIKEQPKSSIFGQPIQVLPISTKPRRLMSTTRRRRPRERAHNSTNMEYHYHRQKVHDIPNWASAGGYETHLDTYDGGDLYEAYLRPSRWSLDGSDGMRDDPIR